MSPGRKPDRRLPTATWYFWYLSASQLSLRFCHEAQNDEWEEAGCGSDAIISSLYFGWSGRRVMTTLTVSIALALAAQCAAVMDPHILIGIGEQESGLNTLALHINGMQPGWPQPHPGTAADAARAAGQFISAGHSVDLGLMQINSNTLPMLGLDLMSAFDPCRSLSAAAKLLTSFGQYNTGSPSKGIANGYALSVAARIHALRTSESVDAPLSLGVACPEPDPTFWHATLLPPGCQPSTNSPWHVTPQVRAPSQ
jgi:type IV secretion system protein VirB1